MKQELRFKPGARVKINGLKLASNILNKGFMVIAAINTQSLINSTFSLGVNKYSV